MKSIYPGHEGASLPPIGVRVELERYGRREKVVIVYRDKLWCSEEERGYFEEAPRYRRGALDVAAVKYCLVRLLEPRSALWWSTPYPVQLIWPGKGGGSFADSLTSGIRRLDNGWRWCCAKCWAAGRQASAAGMTSTSEEAAAALRRHTCA